MLTYYSLVIAIYDLNNHLIINEMEKTLDHLTKLIKSEYFEKYIKKLQN